MRIAVRVTPGSRQPGVGGRYGEAEPPVLTVRVRERAVDGAANEAVIAAIASAFFVPKRSVSIAAGAGSRAKLVEVEGDHALRLSELTAGAQG